MPASCTFCGEHRKTPYKIMLSRVDYVGDSEVTVIIDETEVCEGCVEDNQNFKQMLYNLDLELT